MSLSFNPKRFDLIYKESKYISSALLHLDEMQCGSRGLKNNTSPGRRGIDMPKHGKLKNATTVSVSW